MSQSYNTFSDNLAQAFIQVLNVWYSTYLDFAGSLSVVDTSGDQDIYEPLEPDGGESKAAADLVSNLPRVIVSPGEGVEEIYHTGNMRIPVEIHCKTDLDIGGYPQAKALFAATLDACQSLTLLTQLNATSDQLGGKLVGVHGVVINGVRLNDASDRIFHKTITLDVFGYSVPVTQPS